LPLTPHFKATVAARVRRDPSFREALLREGIETLLAGDVTTGKAVLRDYINAAVGFEPPRSSGTREHRSQARISGRGESVEKKLPGSDENGPPAE
jgi:hypothetical protein